MQHEKLQEQFHDTDTGSRCNLLTEKKVNSGNIRKHSQEGVYMFNALYEYITYNPDNIPIKEIFLQVTPILIDVWVALTIVFWLYGYGIFGKLSNKTLIIGFILPPYLFFTLLWQDCFTSEPWVIKLIPLYSLIIFLVIKKIFKKIRERLKGKN